MMKSNDGCVLMVVALHPENEYCLVRRYAQTPEFSGLLTWSGIFSSYFACYQSQTTLPDEGNVRFHQIQVTFRSVVVIATVFHFIHSLHSLLLVGPCATESTNTFCSVCPQNSLHDPRSQ